MLKAGLSRLVKHKDKLEAMDRQLLISIARHTGLTENDVRTLDIEDIEKKVGIKAKAKRIHFSWENVEKEGWQNLRFIDEEKLKKREMQMDRELMTQDIGGDDLR